MQYLYIQNHNMCLSKKILYQYFVVFCPAWDSFSSENILYVMCKTFYVFHVLCLYKIGNFGTIIKMSSSIFFRYDLFDPPFICCCSFSSHMVNKMVDLCHEKFHIRLRFSFEAYAKNVREKATKCSLKLLRFYWMLMDMCLPTFDIDQDTVVPNCFKSHTNSWYPEFFQKASFVWCSVWNSPCPA